MFEIISGKGFLPAPAGNARSLLWMRYVVTEALALSVKKGKICPRVSSAAGDYQEDHLAFPTGDALGCCCSTANARLRDWVQAKW